MLDLHFFEWSTLCIFILIVIVVKQLLCKNNKFGLPLGSGNFLFEVKVAIESVYFSTWMEKELKKYYMLYWSC